MGIRSYGCIFALENMLEVSPKLRAAHRYITRAAHRGWRQFADLPGPNISNHRLYSVYRLHSLSEIHRKRQNNFLIKAVQSENEYIKLIIGHQPRITA